jgi:hypothetical protein
MKELDYEELREQLQHLAEIGMEMDGLLESRLGTYAAVLFRSGAAVCHELAGDDVFHELIDRLLQVLKRHDLLS